MAQNSLKAGHAQAKRAAQAFARGRCLDAGIAIDRAWIEYGAGKARGASRTSLTRLKRAIEATDHAFERRCVRKHPTKR